MQMYIDVLLTLGVLEDVLITAIEDMLDTRGARS